MISEEREILFFYLIFYSIVTMENYSR